MKKLMTEWRNYLKESVNQAAYDGGLYHSIVATDLDNLRDNGLVNLPNELEIEEDKAGIPCTNDINTAKKYGDVILELDEESIANSGQYVVGPDGDNEQGIRVTMTDSSYDSGHGVQDMVDRLGTSIPFSYVKRIIFPQGVKPDVSKMRESGYGGVEISGFPDVEGDQLVNFWTPKEKEQK